MAGAAILFLLGPAERARAQLSSPTSSNAGSGCTGANNTDGFCGSSASVTINTGAQVQSRYAWNINADVGAGSTRDTSGTVTHTVSFNAVAPGSYQLSITNQRLGMVQRNSDIVNCNGQAHMSALGASTNFALTSGSLTSGMNAVDVNNGGGNQQLGVNQSTTGNILRFSNGVSQGHTLTFTWSGNVKSNSCEAAVRLGQQNGSTTSCGACDYPGSPGRTLGNDGNFVTVNFTSFCGDGVINGTGEQCDAGGANGASTSCCTSTCQNRAMGAVCRASTGECDPQETCPADPGDAGLCPTNVFTAANTACTDTTADCKDARCNGAGTCDQNFANEANGFACTDSLFCNGTDTCNAGACTNHTGDPCPGADGDANCAESCNEAADNCLANDPNGSACTGNGTSECSGADTCSSGVCNNNNVAGGTPCTDTSPPSTGNCKDAQCNGSGTCDQNFANETNGTACTGNGTGECSNADTCQTGLCADNDVAAGTQCTDTSPTSAGNCKDAQCNGTGTCDQNFANETNGTACIDGLFCNGTDSCSAGACSTHTGDPCPGADGDANCSESCDEAADNCLAPDPNGSACTGNGVNECSLADTCQTGLCADNDVAAGTQCTDTAPPSTGNCKDAQCNGTGTCDQSFANETNGTACTGNGTGECTNADTCQTGLCDNDDVSAGTPCTDDTNPCTTDNCDGFGTCAHPPGNAGATCRASAGVCDLTETCTGSSATCPADAKSTAECRASAGICDVAENCDGLNDDCPADGFQSSSTVCRASVGVCDLTENCTGSSAACPADAKSTAVCRPSVDICDVTESCDGLGNNCPADGFEPSSTTCRASAGPCDVAENCTGSGPNCPANAFQSSSTVCRPATGVCDVAENCTGSSAPCPNDSVAGAFVGCRPSAGVCDNAENCDGVNKNCPADGFKPSSTVCRASAGVCDAVENCTGSGANCPADGFQPSSTVCRATAGPCDVAENCTGSGVNCPANAFAPASQVCRPSADLCDAVENCTGLGAACPTDGVKPLGSVCRAASNDCDLVETCNGVTSSCPPDLAKPDNTPCTDGSTCTSGELCSGGQCTGGTVNLDSCMDDFLCYAAKAAAPFSRIPGIGLVDQFDPVGTFDLIRYRFICTPANKNNEGLLDANTHLEAYGMKHAAGSPRHQRRTNIKVTNQLGTLRIDTVHVDSLWVPTAKSLSATPTAPNSGDHNVDHFKCYKIKVTPGTPKFPKGLSVGLQDQLQTKTFAVKKPKYLCNPANKNNEGTKNPTGHLMCYSVKSAPPKLARTTVFLNNQFGPSTLTTVKESVVCIPSEKEL